MAIHFRHFKNTDPPGILAIWQRCAHCLGPPRNITYEVFEQMVFGKLHFDYAGFFVALDDEKIVGFAHASFGPSADSDSLDYSTGVICLVLIDPDWPDPAPLANELVKSCEEYLVKSGAKIIYGGCVRPANPFYLGLYGGSEPPGVLEDDHLAIKAFQSTGYAHVDSTQGYEIDLREFRPAMNVKIAQIRRQVELAAELDAVPRNWWEALTLGNHEIVRVTAKERKTEALISVATLRFMDPTCRGVVGDVCGLMDIRVAPPWREKGLASHVLSESFRRMAENNIVRLDAQAHDSNEPLNALLQAMKMEKTSRGLIFRKEM